MAFARIRKVRTFEAFSSARPGLMGRRQAERDI